MHRCPQMEHGCRRSAWPSHHRNRHLYLALLATAVSPADAVPTRTSGLGRRGAAAMLAPTCSPRLVIIGSGGHDGTTLAESRCQREWDWGRRLQSGVHRSSESETEREGDREGATRCRPPPPPTPSQLFFSWAISIVLGHVAV